MSTRASQVLEQALELSDQERAQMIARLIHSLDSSTDENVEAAWEAELKRRIDDVESGRVTPIPWDEARRTIFHRGDKHD